jgi:pyruvate,water dikinase
MSEKIYTAPGPGTWELDTTHFSRPISQYCSGVAGPSFERGFKEGCERYGLFLSYLKSAYIHGFCYSKPVLALVPEDAPPGPPPDGFFDQPELVARFANSKAAIEGRLWRADLKRWDEEIKPDSIRRHQELQAVNPESLDREQLIQHLVLCHENLALMFYRHHIFTIPSIIPTGLYLAAVCQWADISAGEALELLRGSSPVSRGSASVELEHIGKLLRQGEFDAARFDGQSAGATLQALRSLPAPIGPAIENYLHLVGYQLTSGYDITERYALEMPEILVANMWSACAKTGAETVNHHADEADRLAIRNKVPAERRDEFDALLEEARLINRLRDERGIFNEAKALGLSRRAVLEAGRRLQHDGCLPQAALLLHATHGDMLALLRGEIGVNIEDLLERENWYQNATTDDAPRFLGPPPQPPPPLQALPENARRAQAAMGAALGNLFDPPDPDTDPDSDLVIKGLAVSAGTYEGIARIIQNPADFHRLQQGDVMISRNTSAAFNVVMPMLGAIVTDRGGQLSHAAIVAREYGIPALVGTRNATQLIADGARVRVDGVSATIEVLS